MNVMFDFEHDGDLKEWEYSTLEECEKAAQDWFADMCLNDGMDDNEICEDEGYIVTTDDNGVVLTRKKIVLEYTKERSDFDEHRTY